VSERIWDMQRPSNDERVDLRQGMALKGYRPFRGWASLGTGVLGYVPGVLVYVPSTPGWAVSPRAQGVLHAAGRTCRSLC
jgi:hypothetical protein